MTTVPPPAIFFHPDAVETPGKDLVGRRAAGQSFLRGYLSYAGGEEIAAVTQSVEHAKAFQDTVRGMGDLRPTKVTSLRGRKGFSDSGAIIFPGPGYLDAAWRRQRFDPTSCSLIGITHTVSTRRVIESMHTLIAEPVEPWDAIVCTSRAVQSVVQHQMDLEVEYYRQRFGATRVPMPQLPLIPLGINSHDFSRSDESRAMMRARYNTPDDAVVVMTVGRLTSVEKANPAPLFIVLEQIAKMVGKPVHLWMVGWSSRDQEMDLHKEGARALCPNIETHFIDGRDADIRRHIWSGADIFTLPVDNIQETFGLVPVEAMAAGLPVVMPDWNGFRDTVVHNETGFLIPTAMPAAGAGGFAAERFADGTDGYLHYLSIVQQQTLIDLSAYREALLALINDPEKRRTMGDAGRRHVQTHFDWKAIIPQYLSLSQDLAEMRQGGQASTPRLSKTAISPIEIDPFKLYEDYPTSQPTSQSQFRHVRPLDEKGLLALDQLNGRAIYQRSILPNATILKVADAFQSAGTATVADIAATLGTNETAVTSAALFLAKFDYLALLEFQPN